MEAIIKLEDLTVKEWEKGTIEFEVADEEGNPVNGRIAVKIDQKTYFNTVIDGKFSKEFDFSSFHEKEYSLDVIFGGNDEFAPTMKNAKIIIEEADPIYISLTDLQDACYRLIKWIETKKKLPGKILINKQEVTIGNLFNLLVEAVNNIENNNKEDLVLSWAQTPNVSTENITENQLIAKEEYVKITGDIISEIDETNECPSCVEVENGKIGFMNLVYIYSTIVCNSSIDNGLLSGVYIKPWKEIIA